MEDRGLEERSLEGRGLEERSLEDRALEGRGLEERNLEDRALEGRGLEERNLEDCVLEERGGVSRGRAWRGVPARRVEPRLRLKKRSREECRRRANPRLLRKVAWGRVVPSLNQEYYSSLGVSDNNILNVRRRRRTTNSVSRRKSRQPTKSACQK